LSSTDVEEDAPALESDEEAAAEPDTSDVAIRWGDTLESALFPPHKDDDLAPRFPPEVASADLDLSAPRRRMRLLPAAGLPIEETLVEPSEPATSSWLKRDPSRPAKRANVAWYPTWAAAAQSVGIDPLGWRQ
jgi:hypothetical protein